MEKINRLKVISLMGMPIPKFIVWPTDILSLCEMGERLSMEPGFVHIDTLDQGKITFSGLLSKGKPPERRRECVLFTPHKFYPFYIKYIGETAGNKDISEHFYNVCSILKRDCIWNTEALLADMERFEDITDTIPALAKVRCSGSYRL